VSKFLSLIVSSDFHFLLLDSFLSDSHVSLAILHPSSLTHDPPCGQVMEEAGLLALPKLALNPTLPEDHRNDSTMEEVGAKEDGVCVGALGCVLRAGCHLNDRRWDAGWEAKLEAGDDDIRELVDMLQHKLRKL
jgi:hypothetical protein